MIANFDISAEDGSYTTDDDIDLGALYDLDWVAGESDMKEAIKVAVAALAIGENTSFDNVVPDYVEDENGDTLSITGEYWLDELGQFAWHLFSRNSDESDHVKYFACVDNQGWEFTDFDRLSDAEDNFYGVEEDLDPEDYARENGEAVPEGLEAYFDYEQYGRDLLADFSQVEYGGKTYLFTE